MQIIMDLIGATVNFFHVVLAVLIFEPLLPLMTVVQ